MNYKHTIDNGETGRWACVCIPSGQARMHPFIFNGAQDGRWMTVSPPLFCIIPHGRCRLVLSALFGHLSSLTLTSHMQERHTYTHTLNTNTLLHSTHKTPLSTNSTNSTKHTPHTAHRTPHHTCSLAHTYLALTLLANSFVCFFVFVFCICMPHGCCPTVPVCPCLL